MASAGTASASRASRALARQPSARACASCRNAATASSRPATTATPMRDCRARAVADQQRQQFDDLARVEEVGRIERVAQIHALLAADPGRDQHERRQDEQPAMRAAEQRVDGQRGEREQQDRRPAGRWMSAKKARVEANEPRAMSSTRKCQRDAKAARSAAATAMPDARLRKPSLNAALIGRVASPRNRRRAVEPLKTNSSKCHSDDAPTKCPLSVIKLSWTLEVARRKGRARRFCGRRRTQIVAD